jgi:hypothetical protein
MIEQRSGDTNERAMRLIYIGGYSRSGSTLLLRLLGEAPGLVAVGELFDLWQRSYIENQLCGCGEVFMGCPFWRKVTIEAFGSAPEEVASHPYQDMRAKVQGHSHIHQLWFPLLRQRRYSERLAAYVGVLSRIYKAIETISGARYIVDSSKVPQFAWLLSEMPETEVHMVHLVRDSRATAYSWQRRRVRPEIAWKVQHMDRHSLLRSALEWDLFNLMLRSRRGCLASYTLIRYEDLVQEPAYQLQRIAASIGEKWDTQSEGIEKGKLNLHISHTASGNPSRFKSGETEVRRDDEWIRSMRADKKVLVSALTIGGLARYGYRLRQG